MIPLVFLWLAMSGQGQHTCSKGAAWSKDFQMCLPVDQAEPIICNGPCGDPCYRLNSAGNGWDYICATDPMMPHIKDAYIEGPNIPKSAGEHVIEIRVKIAKRDIGADCNICDDHGCTMMWCELPNSSQCAEDEIFVPAEKDEIVGKSTIQRMHYYCERFAKTLWIDGQRVGQIREVEDK